ncbi:TetR/AcrR family transcriptional regulator [Streptomyces sp. NPDC001732]
MTRRSAEERREQLVEAALKVMIRDGVAKATTRAIVGEAGLPLGAFHYCFRSKEELLHGVIERIMHRTLPPVPAPATRAEDSTPHDIIRTALHTYWDRVRERPEEHLVTYELTQYALRKPGLADVARRQYAHYLQVMRDHLDAIADTAGISWTVDAAGLARYSLGVMDGLTLTWLIDRDDPQSLAALDEYVDHLCAVAAPDREGART